MKDLASLPELLMPAGGFDSALASIEGGADALYLGFAEFSARKQARNFDRLEYRRLHRLSRDRGIKLYATLNTIILEEEIEAVASLLAFLGRFPPNAILVQDWGLAALVRERHPGIAIHASTQAAAQGAQGARIARELGATRVVLPRETGLAEMRRLAEEEPGIEYEAFVHGALCYSFSGLCLASGLVLGRSGNRGECAQLCRSFYDSVEGDCKDEDRPRTGRDGRGYWFSCKDMELGERVAELADAGIASLKVEGRMKGPENGYATARLYRGILDGLVGKGPGENEIAARRSAARTAFSRSPTAGWLYEKGGASLIDPEYPGHRGVSAGRIESVSGSRLVIRLDEELGLRDGLLAFEDGDPFKPRRFAATGMRDPRSGRELVRAKAGARVELDAPIDEGRRVRLEIGSELRRISARDMDRRVPSPEEYEPSRQVLSLLLRARDGRLSAELEAPNFSAESGERTDTAGRIPIEPGEELDFDRSRMPGGFERALSVFSESGDADFRLSPATDENAEVELRAGAGEASASCAMRDLFVPPSALKREKNRIYSLAARIVSEAELAYARASAAWRPASTLSGAAGSEAARIEAPPRAALVFPRASLPAGMPFAARKDLAEEAELPRWGGRHWLPLAPLVADRALYGRLAKERVAREIGEGKEVAVGIGALHHAELARELIREAEAAQDDRSSRLRFFLDFGLYVANRLAFAILANLAPRIDFAYRYLEAEGKACEALAPIGEGFEPPLFQSLGCALKHHVRDGRCPPDCPRSWSAAIRDRERRYRIVVEDCVTMLFREGGREGKGIDGG